MEKILSMENSNITKEDIEKLNKQYRDIHCQNKQIREEVEKVHLSRAYYDYFIQTGEQVEKMLTNVYEVIYRLKQQDNIIDK